ncbi:MAG: phage portal protein [Kordiimonadaceae bacterium]|nr:phage portal protein [Kordiimonadaceae bacterium]
MAISFNLPKWLGGSGGGDSHLDNFIQNNPMVSAAASRAGVRITLETALQLSAVHRAVTVLSNGVAQVDLRVFEETIENGKLHRKPAYDHPAFNVLYRRVNPWLTSFRWRQVMMWHIVLTGVGRSIINRVNGQIDSLIPVVPGTMKQIKLATGEIKYEQTFENGAVLLLDRQDVFEVQNASWDGEAPLDSIKIAAETLGLTASLEQSQANFQRTDMRPAGILSMGGEKGLSKEAKEMLKDTWEQKYGPNGKGGIAVLDGDWKFNTMTMTASDAQLIENRDFQIDEVARHLGVFPQMLFTSPKTQTYASSEQFFQAHNIHGLDPHHENWRQEIDLQLLPEPNVYARFNTAKLMAGTLKDRGEYFAKALGAGGHAPWMTQDEVRMEVDLNPSDEPHASVLGTGAMNVNPVAAEGDSDE